ncbi:MAG: GntR family transcriptional regulator [Arenicella sp.]
MALKNNKIPTEEKEQPMMLKDSAYIKIENMIVTGELEPSRWVSETELVKLSGFSRASVRSAIQRLSDQELLAVFPSKGAQVCPIDYTQQFRALELRRVLEEFIVLRAMKRATKDQKKIFAEISSNLMNASKNADQDALTEYDRKHFMLTLEIADNHFATKPMLCIKGLSRRFWLHHVEEFGDIPKMAEVLSTVSQALAGDSEKEAKIAIHNLIDYIEEFTLSVVGYQPNR